MAQSALTVTTPNPTPPTNLSSVGVTGPNPPNLQRQTYQTYTGVGNPFVATGAAGSPGLPPSFANPPPYFNDGIPQPTASFASGNEVSASVGMPVSCLTFAANTAALTGGVSANDTGTGSTISNAATGAGGNGVNSAAGTYAGQPVPPNSGLVPAPTSVAHEGAGTETLFTQTYNTPQILAPIVLKTVGCGPNASAASILAGPNASHASSLSPATNPTLTSLGTPSSASGASGTYSQTVTGTNFTPQSVIYVNGVAQATTYTSPTTLTAPAVTKKTSAGTWPVTVVTGGVVTTAPQTWTFT